MGKVYQNVTELIGHTPLLEVQNIESELGLKAKILVKLELFNPAGSVKDRVAKNMVEEAERQGILKRGGQSSNLQVEIPELDLRPLRHQRGIVQSLQCLRR